MPDDAPKPPVKPVAAPVAAPIVPAPEPVAAILSAPAPPISTPEAILASFQRRFPASQGHYDWKRNGNQLSVMTGGHQLVAANVADQVGWERDHPATAEELATPPVVASSAYVTAQGATLSVLPPGVMLHASSPAGKPLVPALVDKPKHGTVELSPDGAFVYAPAADYAGADAFTYQTSDGTNTSPVATIALTVVAPPEAVAAANPPAIPPH